MPKVRKLGAKQRQALEMIARRVEKKALLEEEISALVGVARDAGMIDGVCVEASWREVGEALGVTGQAAMQKYGKA